MREYDECLLTWSPLNCFSLVQSLNAVTKTTITTARRMASPSIQSAWFSSSPEHTHMSSIISMRIRIRGAKPMRVRIRTLYRYSGLWIHDFFRIQIRLFWWFRILHEFFDYFKTIFFFFLPLDPHLESVLGRLHITMWYKLLGDFVKLSILSRNCQNLSVCQGCFISNSFRIRSCPYPAWFFPDPDQSFGSDRIRIHKTAGIMKINYHRLMSWLK